MRKIGTNVAVVSGLVALVALPSPSAAQERLSGKQMEALVAKASTPAEHAQLKQHYLDMVAIYTADADAYTTMVKAYKRHQGQASQPASGDPAAQMERIAQRAREAAATARELATYHERLSAGAPKSDAKMPRPHPAMPMAQVEVVQLIETAKTPADHQKLSRQFAAESVRFTEDADRHAAMSAGYRANPNRGGENPAVHCDRFVQQVREAAAIARDLAAYHERVAAGVRQ